MTKIIPKKSWATITKNEQMNMKEIVIIKLINKRNKTKNVLSDQNLKIKMKIMKVK